MSGVVAIGIFVTLYVLGRWAAESPILDWGDEDGPIEVATAIFWAMACIVCAFRLLTGHRPRLLLAFWAFATFVFLGEEISWFQRIIGFDTPEAVRAINQQGEFNFHNLEVLSPPGFELQNLFRLGFFTYFLLLPLATMSSERVRLLTRRVGYRVPGKAFLAMVWGVIAVSVVTQLTGPEVALRATVESREAFYAFSVLVYVYMYLREAPPSTDEVEPDDGRAMT